MLAEIDDSRLASDIIRALERRQNVVSVVSYWEVAIKSQKGKLDIDAEDWWLGAQSSLAAQVLPLRPSHISKLRELPDFHSDPFDRILLAQAIAEGLVFLTTDQQLDRYASRTLRIIC